MSSKSTNNFLKFWKVPTVVNTRALLLKSPTGIERPLGTTRALCTTCKSAGIYVFQSSFVVCIEGKFLF